MNKTVNTTIDILGKTYSIRCLESELELLKKAGDILSRKMAEVQASGKAINLERIAIITALIITRQFLMQEQQKDSLLEKVNQHITRIQDKLDQTINGLPQIELAYTE